MSDIVRLENTLIIITVSFEYATKTNEQFVTVRVLIASGWFFSIVISHLLFQKTDHTGHSKLLSWYLFF